MSNGSLSVLVIGLASRPEMVGEGDAGVLGRAVFMEGGQC